MHTSHRTKEVPKNCKFLIIVTTLKWKDKNFSSKMQGMKTWDERLGDEESLSPKTLDAFETPFTHITPTKD